MRFFIINMTQSFEPSTVSWLQTKQNVDVDNDASCHRRFNRSRNLSVTSLRIHKDNHRELKVHNSFSLNLIEYVSSFLRPTRSSSACVTD